MSLEYEDKMIKLKSNEKKKIEIHKKIVKTDERRREIRRERLPGTGIESPLIFKINRSKKQKAKISRKRVKTF